MDGQGSEKGQSVGNHLEPLFVLAENGASVTKDNRGAHSNDNDPHHGTRFRLVGYRCVVESDIRENANVEAKALDAYQMRQLRRLASLSLRHFEQQQRTQRGILARFSRRNLRGGVGSFAGRVQRLTPAIAVGVLLIAAMFIPVPRNVETTGALRPKNVQSVCAIRDADVHEILVKDGQSVQQGQVLIRLRDSNIDQEQTRLLGRKGVLLQEQSELTQAIVESSSTEFEKFESLQSKREIIREELASIDSQLEIVSDIQQSLVIRSDRDGIVDAWQADQRLASRPVKRGQVLMSVVSEGTPWLVDALVDQRKVQTLREARNQDELTCRIMLEEDPENLIAGTLNRFGPSIAKDESQDGIPGHAGSCVVEVKLNSKTIPRQHDKARANAPARIVFQCGSASLGQALFGDLIRATKAKVSMHFGVFEVTDHDKNSTESGVDS